jgi:F-type H+-transporting ATPase subunit b
MKKQMPLFLNRSMFIAAVLATPLMVLAAEGHGGEHVVGLDEQTLKTIVYQIINVGALIAGLIYFLRKPTREFFKSKKETFVATARKSQEARQAAENERMQIQVRLNKLESTTEESLGRAKAEAAEMRTQMLVEAESISRRIREEANSAARLEVERAKNYLREQMIIDATALSRTQMQKVTTEDHQRLQGAFIDNIQAVR